MGKVHIRLSEESACLQDEITRKGVVFNEMKGVYSSPDSVNQRTVQHSLFPDNTYGEDSGGDPKVIPQLTFEEFKVTTIALHCSSSSCVIFWRHDQCQCYAKLVQQQRRE